MRRRYLGGNANAAAERRGEALTGSMLPTYGEDEHMQSTAPPPTSTFEGYNAAGFSFLPGSKRRVGTR